MVGRALLGCWLWARIESVLSAHARMQGPMLPCRQADPWQVHCTTPQPKGLHCTCHRAVPAERLTRARTSFKQKPCLPAVPRSRSLWNSCPVLGAAVSGLKGGSPLSSRQGLQWNRDKLSPEPCRAKALHPGRFAESQSLTAW